MKNLFFACFLLVGLGSCGVNQQAQQIKALEKCDYRLTDATNITIAGTNIKKLIDGKSTDYMSLPGLALSEFRNY